MHQQQSNNVKIKMNYYSQNPAAETSGKSKSSNDPHSFIPLRRYLSREQKNKIKTTDLPRDKEEKGVWSPAGIFFQAVKLTVPLAYIYILLVLIRESYFQFVHVHDFLETYLPALASFVSSMRNVSKLVETWAIIEAIFYITLQLHIRWLQYKDPLEASLNCAPMLEMHERQELWSRIMDSESEDMISFLTGWFFDEKLENISKYDVLDYVTWSLFDGRNQEHLSSKELEQLDAFVDELEWRIGQQLYGRRVTDVGEMASSPQGSPLINDTERIDSCERSSIQKVFRFPEHSPETPPGFFTYLFENYKHKYEQYRQMLEKADFHPVQDLSNFIAEKKQQIYHAEESAMATASYMRDKVYFTFIDEGSQIDKQISALSHSTQMQLSEAWNQMCEMRHETAKCISSRRAQLRQQMKSYKLLLDSMRSMSPAVPPRQMADLMQRITLCNKALENIEFSARDAFMKATGIPLKTFFQGRDPQRYAKYSRDPLLGVSTFPLCFHILALAVFSGLWKLLMKMRGFERMTVGEISYYYHPGTSTNYMDSPRANAPKPIVFVHGIGVGLCYYVNLIDDLLKLGRPIFLPEIPYITGFHNWLSPNSILPPAAVASTLTSMLASHGFLRATFMGHSYGTSWLSFMCKLAPSALENVIFIDPICFKLHTPFLTKQFVYTRSDPGCTGYMVRSDVMINWTIQRGFPWARIALFAEEIKVPCAVFLSDRDVLVPNRPVEEYLVKKGGVAKQFVNVNKKYYEENTLSVTIFNGVGHGDWVGVPDMLGKIITAVQVMQTRSQGKQQ